MCQPLIHPVSAQLKCGEYWSRKLKRVECARREMPENFMQRNVYSAMRKPRDTPTRSQDHPYDRLRSRFHPSMRNNPRPPSDATLAHARVSHSHRRTRYVLSRAQARTLCNVTYGHQHTLATCTHQPDASVRYRRLVTTRTHAVHRRIVRLPRPVLPHCTLV